jgi:hypothetical protein
MIEKRVGRERKIRREGGKREELNKETNQVKCSKY